MYFRIIFVIWILIILKCVNAQRRIINGHKVEADKPYMVYLKKHPWSHAHYDGWTCGGAIIHPLHIITSATCVRDVYNVYVISGMKKMMGIKEIEINWCTKVNKRKIVSMCEFRNEEYNVTDFYTYNTSSDNGFDHSTTWAVSNLGLARVDTPFAFHSDLYRFCDYKPAIVSVNFLKRYEQPGTQAIVLGWGNTRFYRPFGNKRVVGSDVLRYVATKVAHRSICLKKYGETNLNSLKDDKTLLCTDGYGYLNDYGLPVNYDDICTDCEFTSQPDNRRWHHNDTVEPKTTLNWLDSFGYGFCQNDQGGPLVTWIGGRETVIGIASAFMVTDNMECKGPFIFASTACSSQLIHCIMTSKLRRSAMECAHIARQAGLKIYQTMVDWSNFTTPAGVRGKKKRIVYGKGPATILYNTKPKAVEKQMLRQRQESDEETNTETTTTKRQQRKTTIRHVQRTRRIKIVPTTHLPYTKPKRQTTRRVLSTKPPNTTPIPQFKHNKITKQRNTNEGKIDFKPKHHQKDKQPKSQTVEIKSQPDEKDSHLSEQDNQPGETEDKTGEKEGQPGEKEDQPGEKVDQPGEKDGQLGEEYIQAEETDIKLDEINNQEGDKDIQLFEKETLYDDIQAETNTEPYTEEPTELDPVYEEITTTLRTRGMTKRASTATIFVETEPNDPDPVEIPESQPEEITIDPSQYDIQADRDPAFYTDDPNYLDTTDYSSFKEINVDKTRKAELDKEEEFDYETDLRKLQRIEFVNSTDFRAKQISSAKIANNYNISFENYPINDKTIVDSDSHLSSETTNGTECHDGINLSTSTIAKSSSLVTTKNVSDEDTSVNVEKGDHNITVNTTPFSSTNQHTTSKNLTT